VDGTADAVKTPIRKGIQSIMKFCKLGLFFALFAAVCLPAAAQTRLELNIPFDFVAAGKSLPAGHYSVATGFGERRAWFISNDHTSVSVLSQGMHSPETTHGASVVFFQSGGTYSLVQIWDGTHTGQKVLKSNVKQTLVAEGGKYVAIAAE
jgi:hypothetical protein